MDITLTKYEVQGGSLHCVKYAVRTSDAVGLEENSNKRIAAILIVVPSYNIH